MSIRVTLRSYASNGINTSQVRKFPEADSWIVEESGDLNILKRFELPQKLFATISSGSWVLVEEVEDE